MKFLIVGLLLLSVPVSASSQLPSYRVRARVDKHADFTRLKTYAWTTGWSAYNHSIDVRLVAAIDRELAGLGFTKLESDAADVLVSYAAVPRTDVDVKSKRAGNPKLHSERPAGTLVVRLLEPGTLRELFWVKGDRLFSSDPAIVEEQIDALVVKLFKKYPDRKS